MTGSTLDIVVVIVYLFVMLLIGLWARKKTAGNKESFLVADRNLGYGMFVPCMCACILGGAMTIGATGLGYSYGISGVIFPVAMGLGVICLAQFVVRKLSKYKILTVGELLYKRFGPTASLFSSFFVFIYLVLLSVSQITAIGAILHVFLGWDLLLSMVLGGLISMGYSTLGGMVAVTFTDFIQFLIMVIGIFFILLPVSINEAGGLSGLQTALDPSYFDLGTMGVSRIASYLLLYILSCMIDQSYWQRAFTARGKKRSMIGTTIAGGFSMIYGLAVILIGMSAAVIFGPGTVDSDQSIFSMMAIQLLPTGVSGFVLVGALSAMMSSMSGPFIAASTVLVNDFIIPLSKNKERFTDKKVIQYNRIILVCSGLVALALSLWMKNVLVALDFANCVIIGGILFPVLAALYWKRATAKGAIISMFASTIAVVVGYIVWGVSSWLPVIPGVIVGLVVLIVATLLTPPEPNRLEQYAVDATESEMS